MPSFSDELIAIHTCAVCGRDMPASIYEEQGCIYCGADSED
jgi:hypothetical protein